MKKLKRRRRQGRRRFCRFPFSVFERKPGKSAAYPQKPRSNKNKLLRPIHRA